MNLLGSGTATLTTQRGQSLIEITVITPLLLIALYVPVDFGICGPRGRACGQRLTEKRQRSESSFQFCRSQYRKNPSIQPATELSHQQGCHGDVLQRNELLGICSGNGSGQLQFFLVPFDEAVWRDRT